MPALESRKKRIARGIVLITTLAIMTFLVMIATMLLTTSHNALRRATSYYWSASAQQAAIAGAVFAQTCLESDMGWMGTKVSGKVIGPTQIGNVQVTQDFDKQIVQGFIFPSGSSGVVGEFRISFNSTSRFPNDNTAATYTSCNNMGTDVTGTALQNGQTFRAVPKRTVNIIVEGITRSGAGGTVLARRVAEIGLYRDMTSIINLAASGGNMVADVDETSGKWNVQMASGLAGNPGIRSMMDVMLYGSTASQFNCTAGSIHLVNGQGTAVAIDSKNNKQAGSLSPIDATADAKANAEGFARIKFDQVKVTTTSTISAGTYVFWDKTSTQPTYYQDLVYAPTDPNLAYSFDPDKKEITVTDSSKGTTMTYAAKGNAVFPSGLWGAMSVNVNGAYDVQPATYTGADGKTATNRSLAIIADPTITDQRISFNFASGQGAVLQNSNDLGHITLRGEVNGSGSVLAKGDISFEGHSALSPNPNAVVTMYSGGDTNLTPILNMQGSLDTKSKSTRPKADAEQTGFPVSAAGTLFTQIYTKMRLGQEALADSPISGVAPQIATLSGAATTSVTIAGYTLDSTAVAAGGTLTDKIANDLEKVANMGKHAGEAPSQYATNTAAMLNNLPSTVAGGTLSAVDAYNSLIQFAKEQKLPSPNEQDDHKRLNAAIGYLLQNGATKNAAGDYTFDSNLTFANTPSTVEADPNAGQPATAEITDNNGNKRVVSAADQEFYGMIYSCGNFATNMPKTANVGLQGAIVAYGGDPSKFNPGDATTYPGANGKGKMVFTGKNVSFTYDPTYLGGLYNLFPVGKLTRSFFAAY